MNFVNITSIGMSYLYPTLVPGSITTDTEFIDEPIVVRFELDYMRTEFTLESSKFTIGTQGRILNSDQTQTSSQDLVNMPYFILYVIAQIGGLMYFLKSILTPMISYVTEIMLKHDVVNQVIRSSKLTSLRLQYSENIKYNVSAKVSPIPVEKPDALNFYQFTESLEEKVKKKQHDQEEAKELLNISEVISKPEQPAPPSKTLSSKSETLARSKHKINKNGVTIKYDAIMRTPTYTTSDLLYDLI